MKYELDSIKQNIIKWVSDNIPDFEFRTNQLESIIHILNNILNTETETTVVQAPTGTGKSLLCIIAAGTLATFYNKKSYILASDLYLWNQYAETINKFKLKQFGYLKGSIGNYRCSVNRLDFTLGKCRMNKVGLANLRNRTWCMTHGYRCAETCIYLKQRFRAEKSPVALLTYQLWLYQMNLVDHALDNNGFLPRDVIFCDECHNIPDIVQKYAQPVLDPIADRDKIKQILEFAIDYDVTCPLSSACMRPDVVHRSYSNADETGIGDLPTLDTLNVKDSITVSGVLEEFDYFVDCIQLSEKYDNQRPVKIDMLKSFRAVINFVSYIGENCSNKISSQKEDVHTDVMTKDEKKDILTAFKLMSWIHNYASLFDEFIKAAVAAGSEYIVLEENVERATNKTTYSFCCVKEDYLCYKFLLKHSEFKVMMSATVGNKNSFADNIGVKYCEKNQPAYFMDIPNIFNFDKSPIYYIPTFKMSYQRKKFDYPKIQQLVYRILSSPQFKDCHGMINTGSYENAKLLFDAAPPEIKKRICMYISAKDKADTIEKYKSAKNKIIIGPTLVEGVDLPDDLCRFIIIVKIPYPNISSKSVKAKMNIFPLWYESTTSNTVIQNIGRGVRNENDYCTTFILDGCFGSLYENTKSQYPPEIRERIKLLNS